MSATITEAPASAKTRQIASPIPLAPPVTSARLPSKRKGMSLIIGYLALSEPVCEDRGMLRDRADAFALLFCLLFVALGSLWLSEVGIQNDEALFSAGIYPPFGIASRLMVMTYVGALKSHLYVPIFKIWPPSAASIRFPALIVGALTVWLFYLLVKRTLGRPAALIPTALLATDPT